MIPDPLISNALALSISWCERVHPAQAALRLGVLEPRTVLTLKERRKTHHAREIGLRLGELLWTAA